MVPRYYCHRNGRRSSAALQNLNPLRAIFVIPNKPAPTLADPDNWSPEMLDFVKCCCQKDPNQRHDSALLSSHPFMKQEVITLRSLNEDDGSLSKLSATAEYERCANNMDRTHGLPALQRLMQQMKKAMDQQQEDFNDNSVLLTNPSSMDTSDVFGTIPASESHREGESVAISVNGYFPQTRNCIEHQSCSRSTPLLQMIGSSTTTLKSCQEPLKQTSGNASLNFSSLPFPQKWEIGRASCRERVLVAV